MYVTAKRKETKNKQTNKKRGSSELPYPGSYQVQLPSSISGEDGVTDGQVLMYHRLLLAP